MSEYYLEIDFECMPEHATHWEKVFNMLEKGLRGWKLQDAIDPINTTAADNLDEVWNALPYGSDSFEVHVATVEGINCHLRLMTGGMLANEFQTLMVNWLSQCPIINVSCNLLADNE